MVTESFTAPAATAAGWTATAPTSYTTSTPGFKYLYAWAKDAAGNVSFSSLALVNFTQASTADSTRPTITAFSVPGTSSSLTVPITAFSATDNVGVTGYMVTESFTAPAATAAGWTATAPTSYTVSAGGVRTLYAWAKDAAGNVSVSRSTSVSITVLTGSDSTRPTITTFSVPAISNSLDVPINLAATDNVGVTGYLVKTNSLTPSNTSLLWTPTPPASYRFLTPGAKTLYAWVKDAAGNVSQSRTATVTINTGSTTADSVAPSITSFKVPASSSSLTVAISSLSATDNLRVTGYMVSESPLKPSPDDPMWRPSPPTSYRFTTAGTKTLYAWVKDAAGNVSQNRMAVVRISLPSSTPSLAPALPRSTIKK